MRGMRAARLTTEHRDLPILQLIFPTLSWCSLAFLFVALPGCSVAMALKQPENKNLHVLEPGTPRATVIDEFGLPRRTDEYRGEKVDAFKISEGTSKEDKLLRAGLHLTADAFTFGLWELYGVIIEKALRPSDISLEVHYDAYDRVTNLKVLSNDSIFLAKAPVDTLPTAATPPILPSTTPVLMPQPIASAPQQLAVIVPHGANT